MYHYCFECRLNAKPRGNTRFVVEGTEPIRKECEAIHNALLHSPDIVISNASIEEVS